MIEPAYMAGVLDSDGSISFTRRKKTATVHGYIYRIVFQLTWKKSSKVEHTMEEMVKSYGGHFNLCNRKKTPTSYGNTPIVLKYSVEGYAVRKLLVDVLPFLRLKRRQCVLALRYLSLKEKWEKSEFWTQRKPQRIWDAQERLYLAFRNLNTKNGGSHE